MSSEAISFSIDSRDIRFGLFDVFQVQDLSRFERFQHLQKPEMEDILARAERTAIEVLSPLNRIVDSCPPQYVDGRVTMPEAFHPAFRDFCEGDWISLTLGREAGGRAVPESLGAAVREMFNGACGSFYAVPSLTSAALQLIENTAPSEIKALLIGKMASGTYTGTMCLTESEAGSFLADITTRALRKGDYFLIKGKKIFIGGGEHDLSENIVHCVLARIEGAPSGYSGISLFAVPKYRMNKDGTPGAFNGVYGSGIERKMGWYGAPTATLHFGEADECWGWLIGEEGKGLSHMFQMMNEMRLSTGVQGIGQAAAAYQMALAFAKERVQGLSYKRRSGESPQQVRIIEHPDVRRNLLFMKAAVEGCRRLAIQTGMYMDLARAVEDEDSREYYEDLVEILTPVCKAYCTDMAFRVAETAIQCMGGRGYTKDYQVEQYLRDLKVACIYEGTNGIQAIDLQRRKLNLKDGKLFRNLIGEIESFTLKNMNHTELHHPVQELERAKGVVIEAAKAFSAKRQEDTGLPLSVAKPFLDLTGHFLCTWLLLKTAAAAQELLETGRVSEEDRAFYQGKIYTARFAASDFLGQLDGLAKTIFAWDRSVLDIEEAGF